MLITKNVIKLRNLEFNNFCKPIMINHTCYTQLIKAIDIITQLCLLLFYLEGLILI